MANEKRLIDANGRYTLHASDNTDYSLLFKNGIICVENELGHCVCEFFAEDAPTVDAVEVVHGRWLDVKETEVYSPDHRCTFTHTAETCSNCKVRIGFIGSKQYLYDNQCPNCGAKMDGDGNG